MKKFLWLIPLVFFALFWGKTVWAVDYSIESYRGDLTMNADNTATYVEEVVYQFDSSYNGQFVTLGSAGKMPAGFSIDSNPKVEVAGARAASTPEVSRLSDGYEIKIYNGGDSGDRVTVRVEWQLTNLLFVHSDILELHWTPISDWDEGMKKVELTVHPRFAAADAQSEFYVHTGYLARPASIVRQDGGYQISLSDLGEGKKVELHAYWDKAGLSGIAGLEQQSTGQTALADFQNTENGIAFRNRMLQVLLYWVLPVIFAVGLIASVLLYLAFRRSIKTKAQYPKDSRLYEIPQDLAPLVVASNVYSVDLDEVNPSKGQASRLKFENMIQATLLDLVDRGNLDLISNGKNPIIRYQHDKGLSAFEKSFLKMALGSHTQASADELFDDYQISDSLYKGGGKKDESYIRSVGSQLKNRFDSALDNISKQVHQEVKSLHLPDNYRPLNKKEKGLMVGAIGLSGGVAVLSLAAGLLPFIFYSAFLPHFVPFLILGGLAAFILGGSNITYQRDGVLNENGAQQYYYWQSFENMLRQISNLNQTEIEGLVLWNRLLVYATLYGCADKVSKVMKLRHIQLENQSMNDFVYFGWNYALFSSAANLRTYSQTASQASNFSVSSSGSGGGGFSGGGGGGGGGAF